MAVHAAFFPSNLIKISIELTFKENVAFLKMLLKSIELRFLLLHMDKWNCLLKVMFSLCAFISYN